MTGISQMATINENFVFTKVNYFRIGCSELVAHFYIRATEIYLMVIVYSTYWICKIAIEYKRLKLWVQQTNTHRRKGSMHYLRANLELHGKLYHRHEEKPCHNRISYAFDCKAYDQTWNEILLQSCRNRHKASEICQSKEKRYKRTVCTWKFDD